MIGGMKLFLYGSFQVFDGAGGEIEFRSETEKALLAYLSVESGRPHPRTVIASLLWPEIEESQARNNLRVALHRLRRLIEGRQGQDRMLSVTRQALQIDPGSGLWVDQAEFERLVAAAAGHNHASQTECEFCRQDLAQAVALYRGEFLEGFVLPQNPGFEEWSGRVREISHRKVLAALYDLSSICMRQSRFSEAEEYARRQLALEPWREKAHRQLMRVLAASGERSLALSQYETLEKILKKEFDAEPSVESRQLLEDIRSNNFRHDGEFEPAAPPPARVSPEPSPPPPAESVPQHGSARRPGRLPGLAVLLIGLAAVVAWIFLGPSSRSIPRYDRFNAGAQAAPVDPARWVQAGLTQAPFCSFVQQNGRLVFSVHRAAGQGGCALQVNRPLFQSGEQIRSLSVRLQVPEEQADLSLGLRISASYPDGDWSADCGLAWVPEGPLAVFIVSDTRLDHTWESGLATASRPLEAGTWYEFRLDVVPETWAVSCALNGRAIGTFTPDNAGELAQSTFLREILSSFPAGIENSVLLDDFRLLEVQEP